VTTGARVLPSPVTAQGHYLHYRVLCFVFRLLLLALMVDEASAHDPSSYGGVFRSRNLGASWLSADVGLFLNAALIVAINPKDQAHLLAGTDLGLIDSRNAGLSWKPEARDLIFGAVFALTFLMDGQHAICAAQNGVFRLAGGRWLRVVAPDAALPAKTLVAGGSAHRVYLLGRKRLFISADMGESFAPAPMASPTSEITALTVVRSEPELVLAVVDGEVMASIEGRHEWRARGLGNQSEPVHTVAADPQVPGRIWAAQTGRIHASDDLGGTWRAVGRALPEPQTLVRGIAANAEATILLVSTNRGLYRSENAGETWALKEDNLPIHLEAGPLARDPGEASLIYVVYSLMPYSEVWRLANEGGSLIKRLDPISLLGGIALWLLILLAGWWSALRLVHWRAATGPDPK
jgi:photosystem II stability/assembly factor-like uncharacterized protein